MSCCKAQDEYTHKWEDGVFALSPTPTFPVQTHKPVGNTPHLNHSRGILGLGKSESRKGQGKYELANCMGEVFHLYGVV